ncbi:sugar-binding transcriptional regulator [Gorillibacterium massiliense]|uniref:sugar-binding transcriptional regulator n=1 Tax=Gorillibacterium massiliense TaxID=1280390 RepID=UPI0004B7E233|nr:sugar-binding domain-containing protein [Gorillibacterium massiliense]
MKAVLDLQKQLLPDVLDIIKKRYQILHHVMAYRVVGRRTLAASLHMTERVLRAEVDFLKEQGLLEVESFGIKMTPAGKKLLDEMEPMMKEMTGLARYEEQLRQRFGIGQVIVVHGDSDESSYVKQELGRMAALALRKSVQKETVVAVSGGSTIYEVAQQLASSTALKGSIFVPARGGLGESVEYQANTVASVMAKKTGGQHRMLHVPDHLGEEAYQTLLQEPNIQEVVQVIRSARIVVHGIGEAKVMAKRRKASPELVQALLEEGALGEAFGYYFDRNGVVVNRMPTVGLKLEDLQNAEKVIAVAGGSSKGESIASVLRYGCESILVTDEGAAKKILQD